MGYSHSMDLESLLRTRFGHPAFRPGQRAVVEQVTDGADALVVMPTGHGKSICYQLPALARGGTTLVISPLIALMKNQVDAVVAQGMRATLINSSLDWRERDARIARMTRGEFDLVYVAPERFNPGFMTALEHTDVRLLAVDEAHCVSQWGHDFRPDYLRLSAVRSALSDVPTVALTATATPRVQDDILRQLGIKEAQRFITGFDRENLSLEVIAIRTLRDKHAALPRLLQDQPALVYCATRKNVEAVTAQLQAGGQKAGAYHAGLEHTERRRVQEAFFAGDIPIVVATNAFGMGLDKANIRTIVHFDLTGTIEAYYQEIGRAGRDGRPARAVLLYRPADRRTQEFFIEGSHPPVALVRRVHQALQDAPENPVWWSMEQLADEAQLGQEDRMARSCLTVLRGAGLVSRASRRSAEDGHIQAGIMLTDPEARLTLDEAEMKQRRDLAFDQLDEMVGYGTAPCQRRMILDHFGEQPSWERCGRCSGCMANRPLVQTAHTLEAPQLECVRKVLACMARMQRPFSSSMIARVVTGSRDKSVRAFGFERLSTYGILSGWSQARVEQLLTALVRADAIQATRTTRTVQGKTRTYQDLKLTALGHDVMTGKKPELALVWPGTKAASIHRDTSTLSIDNDLLARLRAVRLTIARDAGVPAYVVAPNRTLEVMAAQRPTTKGALSGIHGMGPQRIARYGAIFVDAVRGWTEHGSRA